MKKKIQAKVKAKAKAKVSTGEALEKLVLAVCETYARDPSKPSVLVSQLGKTGQWYASVVRYRKAYGEDKVVVQNGTGPTLAETIRDVARAWLNRGAARRELHGAVFVGSDDDLDLDEADISQRWDGQ